ncbi:FtsB family cell division protein [Haloechinothrix alba]|nr:septum formation initiator family protein [Haloechinothrix alba]
MRTGRRATAPRSTAPRTTSKSATSAPASKRSAPASGSRRSAAEKAYARRAQRSTALLDRGAGAPAMRITQLTERGAVVALLKRCLPKSRSAFVLTMMGLLTAGLGLTLWLSTQAIADSYRLETVRAENASLAERVERLQREVTRQESAASLAERARELGMVPSGDPARIIVEPDGETRLFGDPEVVDSSGGGAAQQGGTGG